MVTDTTERGLESLIVEFLTGQQPSSRDAQDTRGTYGGGGYLLGDAADFDRDHALDLRQLLAFLSETQPRVLAQLGIAAPGPERVQFLARLTGEIAKRGVVDVLRRGIHHGPLKVELYFVTPSPDNTQAVARFAANRFTVTRQLRYSPDATRLALDLVLFINGLPLVTFELKNSLTKQNTADAVLQYQTRRDPAERLFQFGRCLVHLAVDDQDVQFCTELKGKDSWFLPFNKGWQDGAGNPPNPLGIKTDYLWRVVLTRACPGKLDTCVLDFYNDADTIQAAFQPYYRTTILSGGTDPNRLHDLTADLDRHQVFKRFQDDDQFRDWLSETVFAATYQPGSQETA